MEPVVSSALANHRPRWTWATTAIINRKISAGGSGDYTTPSPINTSAEHKIGQYSVLPYRSKTYPGRLARFGRFCQHNLTVARPTKGRLAKFCYTVKTTKHQQRKFHK
ncbi:Uncharacterized protein FWK35_00021470 [Aphis craccivora]|uniref:Uncharacterized protein n=1 Tax=Aphis craccivora TaxID=307492 RepID=A0A6G0YJZ5_APHCR|nr:Uncharacterized protein FWK35_00021470 [Aphis craccivora]